MSAAPVSPKRFLLAVSGDIVNVDYVTRVSFTAGKIFADMATGPPIELRGSLDAMENLRRMLPLNAGAP